jgi:hypothetical protein
MSERHETGEQVRAAAGEAARQKHAVLAAITDPDDELTASAATRHRMEGAALTLEAIGWGLTGDL